MTGTSLFAQIVHNLEKGELKKDFSFPVLVMDGEPVYAADGMLDAIYIMQPEPEGQVDAKGAKKIARALKAASSGDLETAAALFSELGSAYRAVTCAGEIQACIRRHGGMNAPALFEAGIRLVTESEDRECVKFGLCILERFRITNQAIKSMVFTTGLSDEFTLFAGYAMSVWEDGSEYMFRLLKHVHGWGKIALAARVEADTAAKRNWFLHHGMENTVNGNYLAATAFVKSGASARLKKPMKPEAFRAVTELIDKMTDEEPAAGLSALADPEAVLNDYLDRAGKTDLDAGIYNLIARLSDWAAEYEYWDLYGRCFDGFLSTEDCRKKALYAARCGEACDLACVLDIPFEEDLLRHMELDFDRFYDRCGYILDTGENIERLLDLFRKRIDPDTFAGVPGETFRCEQTRDREDILEFLLEELSYLPLTGTDLVITGLRAPGVWVRGRAIFTVSAWVAEQGVPLKDLSAELYTELRGLSQKEPVDALKEAIWRLLSGDTAFEEGDLDEPR